MFALAGSGHGPILNMTRRVSFDVWTTSAASPPCAPIATIGIFDPALFGDVILTFVPLSGIFRLRIKSRSPLKDASQVTAVGGASAVPAGGGSSLPPPGGFGHHACRYYGRRGRCSLDWDRRARVTPAEARTIFARLAVHKIIRSRHVPGCLAWS
jgi:hypothetical protein